MWCSNHSNNTGKREQLLIEIHNCIHGSSNSYLWKQKSGERKRAGNKTKEQQIPLLSLYRESEWKKRKGLDDAVFCAPRETGITSCVPGRERGLLFLVSSLCESHTTHSTPLTKTRESSHHTEPCRTPDHHILPLIPLYLFLNLNPLGFSLSTYNILCNIKSKSVFFYLLDRFLSHLPVSLFENISYPLLAYWTGPS
jgi:hypothetical protein